MTIEWTCTGWLKKTNMTIEWTCKVPVNVSSSVQFHLGKLIGQPNVHRESPPFVFLAINILLLLLLSGRRGRRAHRDLSGLGLSPLEPLVHITSNSGSSATGGQDDGFITATDKNTNEAGFTPGSHHCDKNTGWGETGFTPGRHHCDKNTGETGFTPGSHHCDKNTGETGFTPSRHHRDKKYRLRWDRIYTWQMVSSLSHIKNVGCSQMGCTYSSSIPVAHKIQIVGRLDRHPAENLMSKHHLDGRIVGLSPSPPHPPTLPPHNGKKTVKERNISIGD